MSGGEIFRTVQALARSGAANGAPAATQEYLLRHALESFLARLTRTPHAEDFVLKGGLLLGGYGVRRSTKDADSNAIAADVTPTHLQRVVHAVAAVEADDGVEFLLDSLVVTDIREDATYPGIRLRLKARVGSWQGVIAWDVSTGDPVVPAPRRVTLPRLLGQPITLLGYAPESTIAEKGVTILERGVTSTRWRDYVDIVTLGEAGIDIADLREAARAVASYRGVELQVIGSVLEGYGAVSQRKWAAWRRKERLEAVSEESLDDQIVRVAAILDPAFKDW
ncbi:nucleotidyl transferase AbiEii/AbiGii toxin family protein [Microbacterium testaceum]|uniref:nucleotidyl transferase AbiEii/AbiGii toxin family protein n=1 Tax=Microbacterium testaceum TaxID=2033 RepID=UPI000733D66F|nr:nucleotidyl transferase AbiEii/AbiGii toxin family protein [Microbacterium testaceum]